MCFPAFTSLATVPMIDTYPAVLLKLFTNHLRWRQDDLGSDAFSGAVSMDVLPTQSGKGFGRVKKVYCTKL